MTDITPPSPSRKPKHVLLTDFFAIVTTDIPNAAGVTGDENVMAVVAGDKIVPLITTKRSQALDAWKNLMASDDPEFKNKNYRLVHIGGKRDVLLEQKKS